jgi:hypothetical protein
VVLLLFLVVFVHLFVLLVIGEIFVLVDFALLDKVAEAGVFSGTLGSGGRSSGSVFSKAHGTRDGGLQQRSGASDRERNLLLIELVLRTVVEGVVKATCALLETEEAQLLARTRHVALVLAVARTDLLALSQRGVGKGGEGEHLVLALGSALVQDRIARRAQVLMAVDAMRRGARGLVVAVFAQRQVGSLVPDLVSVGRQRRRSLSSQLLDHGAIVVGKEAQVHRKRQMRFPRFAQRLNGHVNVATVAADRFRHHAKRRRIGAHVGEMHGQIGGRRVAAHRVSIVPGGAAAIGAVKLARPNGRLVELNPHPFQLVAVGRRVLLTMEIFTTSSKYHSKRHFSRILTPMSCC